MTALRLPRPRPLRPAAILGTAVLLIGAVQAWTLLQPSPTPPATDPHSERPAVELPLNPAPGAPVASSAGLAELDRAIAGWTSNLDANDRDFLSAANLARLFEARAGLSGNVADYGSAIAAADRSLAIEPRQLEVRALHARLHLAIHDFHRALAEAESLDRTAPDQPAILAIIADARLELGEIDAAASLYERIANVAPGPAVTARLARIAMERGDLLLAIERAEAAHAAAEADGLVGPSLGWYRFFAGYLNLAAGSIEAADGWFGRALAAWPESHDALAGRARLAASRGDLDAAVAGYRAAIAIAPEPDLMIALGEVLELRGEATAAAAQYAAARPLLEARVLGRLVFSHQLAVFELDHGGDVARGLELAQADLAARRDAHNLEAYGWALFGSLRAREADAVMAEALALGVPDGMLLFRAGEVALALDDLARARMLLEAAAAVGPTLDPAAEARVEELLRSLR